MYRNEVPSGKAIRDSGIPREEVFFTSKVYQPALTYVSQISWRFSIFMLFSKRAVHDCMTVYHVSRSINEVST